MFNKKFWATTFTLSGTIIGAGILGLPFVISKSGFLVGLIWIILLGIILTFVNLALGEVTLRLNERHQLVGYANEYLGIWGKRLMLFGMLFGMYSALLAYLVGEGESFSKLIGTNVNPIIFGFLFWIVMTLLLREGLRGLKKVETYGVLAVIILIIGIFIKFFPKIEYSNLSTFNQDYIFLPIGVILFALMGFTSIPELRQEIKGQEEKLKKAIILGSLIPVFLYIIFILVFVGVLGTNVTQIATLSFGKITTILGIFTMTTAFFVSSFSLKDLFKYDLKYSNKINFVLVSIIPLLLYLIVSTLNLASFTKILGIGGVISGGIIGILILLMNKKSKEKDKSNKKLTIKIKNNWIIITLISIMFILAIILELMN